MDAVDPSPFTKTLGPPAAFPRKQRLLIRDGHGRDRVEGFCPFHDQIAFDTDEITTFGEVLAHLSQVGDDVILSLDAESQVIFPKLEIAQLTAQNFRFTSHAATLMEGTRIQTERGPIKIEDLRPDDIIWTKQHGWQALQLVIMEKVTFCDRADFTKPVLIQAGALGPIHPTADLITAPTHRILRPYRAMRRSAPKREELVPAASLVGARGIRVMRGKKKATYFNVVLERHSVIQAEGCWIESLQVTRGCLTHQTRAARSLLEQLVGMEPTPRVAPQLSRKRRLKRP